MAQNLRIERLSGKSIERYLPELARLRITVFREFPYLYNGSQEYEEKYLATYVDVPDSVMVLVWSDATVVGASSGLPMAVETPETIQPFL
ncbi:MAG TPA: GNAT family N-acetyltransferase, partial [Candidatus Competibacteraceae bacterium]|nr:GNAT family N-acetyltransferase [Candidatus Competibacteraceae bacterium]